MSKVKGYFIMLMNSTSILSWQIQSNKKPLLWTTLVHSYTFEKFQIVLAEIISRYYMHSDVMNYIVVYTVMYTVYCSVYCNVVIAFINCRTQWEVYYIHNRYWIWCSDRTSWKCNSPFRSIFGLQYTQVRDWRDVSGSEVKRPDIKRLSTMEAR